jgi:hypothetical protein
MIDDETTRVALLVTGIVIFLGVVLSMLYIYRGRYGENSALIGTAIGAATIITTLLIAIPYGLPSNKQPTAIASLDIMKEDISILMNGTFRKDSLVVALSDDQQTFFWSRAKDTDYWVERKLELAVNHAVVIGVSMKNICYYTIDSGLLYTRPYKLDLDGSLEWSGDEITIQLAEHTPTIPHYDFYTNQATITTLRSTGVQIHMYNCDTLQLIQVLTLGNNDTYYDDASPVRYVGARAMYAVSASDTGIVSYYKFIRDSPMDSWKVGAVPKAIPTGSVISIITELENGVIVGATRSSLTKTPFAIVNIGTFPDNDLSKPIVPIPSLTIEENEMLYGLTSSGKNIFYSVINADKTFISLRSIEHSHGIWGKVRELTRTAVTLTNPDYQSNAFDKNLDVAISFVDENLEMYYISTGYAGYSPQPILLQTITNAGKLNEY